MVLDNLCNASLYESLNSRFKQAFDYLKANDLSAVEPCKIVLDGDKLFISLVEINGKKPEDAKMETHDRYIDIQFIIKGSETMGYVARNVCQNETAPYNAEKDITFYSDAAANTVTLKAGDFAIFFPCDGHAPGMGNGAIKKAIVKVLVDR